MECIKLTDEHITKLLEMCDILFPDEIFALTIQENGYLNYSDNSEATDYIDRIHWFEFCMRYISIKVCKSDGITLTFKDDNNNVIEFLYDQFKKLK